MKGILGAVETLKDSCAPGGNQARLEHIRRFQKFFLQVAEIEKYPPPFFFFCIVWEESYQAGLGGEFMIIVSQAKKKKLLAPGKSKKDIEQCL